MVNIPDLMITSLDRYSVYTLTGEPWFVLDEVQEGAISNTEEKVDIVGKQNRKLGSLKREKAATITATNGMLSGGLLEAQTGSTFESLESVAVKYIDFQTVKTNAATTEFKAVGTAGTEIDAIYVLDDSGAATKSLKQGEAAAPGVFSYEPTSKAITFNSGDVADDSRIVVYYTRNVKGDRIKNVSDVHSQKGRIYIDGTAEDRCGNIYRIQFYCPKVDFTGNFDLNMGGDQTVHAFEATTEASTCGNKTADLWSYVVFGANAPDADAKE